MRRCHSCMAEPGEFHTPACESRDRDVAGRFVLGIAEPDRWVGKPLAEHIIDLEAHLTRQLVQEIEMESTLHGGLDDEGDER